MKRTLLTLLVLAAIPAGTALAQLPGGTPGGVNGPYYNNPYSYLNLNRPGNAGINYLGIVRPQQQVDAYLQHQAAMQQASANAGAYDPTLPLQTGNVVRFQSQGSYFGTIRPTPVAPLPVSGLTTHNGTH